MRLSCWSPTHAPRLSLPQVEEFQLAPNIDPEDLEERKERSELQGM